VHIPRQPDALPHESPQVEPQIRLQLAPNGYVIVQRTVGAHVSVQLGVTHSKSQGIGPGHMQVPLQGARDAASDPVGLSIGATLPSPCTTASRTGSNPMRPQANPPVMSQTRQT